MDKIKAKLELIYEKVSYINHIGIYLAYTNLKGCAILNSEGQIIYTSSELYYIKPYLNTIDGDYAIITTSSQGMGRSRKLGKPLSICIVKLNTLEVIQLGEILKGRALYCIAIGNQLRFSLFNSAIDTNKRREIVNEYGQTIFEGEIHSEEPGIGTDIICADVNQREFVITRDGIVKTSMFPYVNILNYGQLTTHQVYSGTVEYNKATIIDADGNVVYTPSGRDEMVLDNNLVELIKSGTHYCLDQKTLTFIPKSIFFDHYAMRKDKSTRILIRQGLVWIANPHTGLILNCPPADKIKSIIADTQGIQVLPQR